jgi:hypothetical protein
MAKSLQAKQKFQSDNNGIVSEDLDYKNTQQETYELAKFLLHVWRKKKAKALQNSS